MLIPKFGHKATLIRRQGRLLLWLLWIILPQCYFSNRNSPCQHVHGCGSSHPIWLRQTATPIHELSEKGHRCRNHQVVGSCNEIPDLFVAVNTLAADNRCYKGYFQQLTMYKYAISNAEVNMLYNFGILLSWILN
jgi:hypothetical protein